MMIRYVRERGYKGDGRDPHLTLGKDYLAVLLTFRPNSAEYPALVSVVTDGSDQSSMFELNCFDVVDGRVPPDWIFQNPVSGWFSLLPKEFTGNFLDLLHDGNEDAEKIFQEVYQKLQAFHEKKPVENE